MGFKYINAIIKSLDILHVDEKETNKNIDVVRSTRGKLEISRHFFRWNHYPDYSHG